MFRALSAVASCPTRASSAGVSGLPSPRLTTTVAVAVAACGNDFAPSSVACTDS